MPRGSRSAATGCRPSNDCAQALAAYKDREEEAISCAHPPKNLYSIAVRKPSSFPSLTFADISYLQSNPARNTRILDGAFSVAPSVPPVHYEMGHPPWHSNARLERLPSRVYSAPPDTPQSGRNWRSSNPLPVEYRETPHGGPGSAGSSESVFEYYLLRHDKEVRYMLKYSHDGFHYFIPLSPRITWSEWDFDLPMNLPRTVGNFMDGMVPVSTFWDHNLTCRSEGEDQEIRRLGRDVLTNAQASRAINRLKHEGRYTRRDVAVLCEKTDKEVVKSFRGKLGIGSGSFSAWCQSMFCCLSAGPFC